MKSAIIVLSCLVVVLGGTLGVEAGSGSSNVRVLTDKSFDDLVAEGTWLVSWFPAQHCCGVAVRP